MQLCLCGVRRGQVATRRGGPGGPDVRRARRAPSSPSLSTGGARAGRDEAREAQLARLARELGRRRQHIELRAAVLADLLSWRFDALAGARLPGQPEGGRAAFTAFIGEVERRVAADITRRVRALVELEQARYSSTAEAGTMSRTELTMGAYHRQDTDFLAGVAELATTARYHVVSAADWRYATEHSYNVTVPVAVRWSAYCPALTESVNGRLYGSEPRLRTALLDRDGAVREGKQARHCLLLHRGVGLDRQRQFFYGLKTDELLRRAALGGLRVSLRAIERGGQRLLRRAERTMAQQQQPPPQEQEQEQQQEQQKQQQQQQQQHLAAGLALPEQLQRLGAPYAEQFGQLQRLGAPYAEQLGRLGALPAPLLAAYRSLERFLRERVAALQTAKPEAQAVEEEEDANETDAELVRALEARLTLPEQRLGPLALLRRTALQEPTYREVLVLYRMADPALPTAIPPALGRQPPAVINARRPNSRAIEVRHFRDVPMANLELVLPVKRIAFKLSDRVSYSLTGALAALSLYEVSLQPLWALPKGWIAAALASLSYLSRLLSKIYMTWAYHSVFTDAIVANSASASGPAALVWLAGEAQEQLGKEVTVTALALAELSPHFCSKGQLQARCRDVLAKVTTGAVVRNFDPTDALGAMDRMGILDTRVFMDHDSGERLYRIDCERGFARYSL
jgi:hypothetical protein